MGHLETSPWRPAGQWCNCLIDRDHTVAEFYDYHPEHVLHPTSAKQLHAESLARRSKAQKESQ